MKDKEQSSPSDLPESTASATGSAALDGQTDSPHGGVLCRPLMRRWIALFLSLALLIGAGLGFLATYLALVRPWEEPTLDGHDTVNYGNVNYALLQSVLATLDDHAYYRLPDGVVLTEELIRAALAATGDRYAAYFTPEEYKAYLTDLAGGGVGIGVMVQGTDDAILVLQVFTDSPAAAVGLEAGDRIVAVGDLSVSEVGYTAALDAVAGEPGTSVTLTYERDGVRTTVTAVRGTVTKDTVISRMVDGDIGYLHITDFDTVTTSQFISAYETLESQGATSFIFDLRGNGGGRLQTVSEMLAYLLPDGVISYIDYTSENAEDYIISSEGDTLYYAGHPYTQDPLGNDIKVSHQLAYPAVVLCDGNTASASELFTSALRDYSTPAFDSALSVTVMGEKTFGKGIMQTTFVYSDGSAVKLTVAAYHPPCGVNYQGIGITPDIEVSLSEEGAAVSLYLRPLSLDAPLQAAIAHLQ